jgi:type 1 fimbria pilin
MLRALLSASPVVERIEMSKSLTLSSIALLLASAAPAFAASNVDLTVKGLITPNACTPTVSAGGVVDHGKIASKDLVQNNPTTLPRVTLQLSIDCDATIPFAIKPIDNRSGSSITSTNFGLGFVNGNKKLGRFYLTPKNMVADGVAVQPIASSDGGRTWYDEWAWELQTLWGAGAMDDATTLLPIKNLVMGLEVGTQINRADQFDFSNETPIDGSATLEVVYL